MVKLIHRIESKIFKGFYTPYKQGEIDVITINK